MKKFGILFLLLALSVAAGAKNWVITDYGVSRDSTQLNTSAIQRVIDKAAANGGGTVVIPKGVFLSGALFFRPGTQLMLLEGAVLKGSDNIADYPVIPSRMEGHNLDYNAALINAYQVKGFKISGPGMINGNGLTFWKAFWSHVDSLRKLRKPSTNLEVHRPRLLFIWGCDDCVIENVKLRNSGFWTTHLYRCNNVKVLNTDIRNPYKPVPAPSSDGIDIDFCNRVLVKGCYISVNDDAVCLKGGKGPLAHTQPENGITENVTVEDCNIGDSHGTLTLGSECVHARNIILRNCVVNANCPLLRFKMRPDTYQVYENITVENITGSVETIISMKPWTQFFDLQGTNEHPFGIVRNIVMKNIKVTCKSFGDIAGNPDDKVSNFLFKDLEIKATHEQLKTTYRDAVIFDNVTINGKPQVFK